MPVFDITESKVPDWKKYLFPCDCSDSHWLMIQWWEDDNGDIDVEWPFMDITQLVYERGIWKRIKASAKVLFGQQHFCGGVVLDLDSVKRLEEIIHSNPKVMEKETTNVDVQ